MKSKFENHNGQSIAKLTSIWFRLKTFNSKLSNSRSFQSKGIADGYVELLNFLFVLIGLLTVSTKSKTLEGDCLNF